MATSINDYQIDSQALENQSVFSAALPYAAGSLAICGGFSYLAVTTMASGGTALPIAAAVAALIGAYGFFTTAVVGIYAKNSAEFNRQIVPALKVSAFAVVTHVISMVANIVLETLIRQAIFGAQGRRS